MPAQLENTKLTFGLFEVDLDAGELWKAGFRVKLQSQPFKVLAALLEKPGHVVTREELQLRLWGKDTVVDFDHSLGSAINKIREALGDSAENPRFIETLSRRGYRFIAPVGHIAPPPEPEPPTAPVAPATAAPPERLAPDLSATVPKSRPLWLVAAIAVATACVAGYLLGSMRSTVVPVHITQITRSGHLAPGAETSENLAAAVTDGVRLYATTIDNGRYGISSIEISSGASTALNIPAEVASPTLGDISSDGSHLLLRDHLSPESEQPLWIVPTTGGSAQRVGNVLAHDATWMPDSISPHSILYASGNEIYLTKLSGNTPELYARLPFGRAFWLRWEPNGHILRFTILDPIAHTASLWQLTPSNRTPVRLLEGFSNPSTESSGVWTADGSAFVFQSSRGNSSNLWKLTGESTTHPTRLTDGPLQFQSPVASRDGHRIFFLGTDVRSDLRRVTPEGTLTPDRSFLSGAVRVDCSHDGKWVAWTDSVGQLWRARSDGTERLQLTPENVAVFLARWSPDASQLAVMAREPGKAWQIYLLGANGGNLQPLLKETRNAADPSWSADGRSIVFGRLNDAMGKESAERGLSILHVASGKIDAVPQSDGLFSPRWSPDGKYIAALTLDQRKVQLFDVAAQTWRTLSVSSGADPVWSADSRFLYLHASLDPEQPIVRVSIPDGHVQDLIHLAGGRSSDAVDYVFGGLTLDGTPIVRTRSFTGNFYSLDLGR